MVDTVVIAEDRPQNSGYRFSWGLAFLGGVAATAVTFFLLVLGSGFGLLLVNPVTHAGPSLPMFLTGGAIYFITAQAFGFATGGYLAGRLLGPLAESSEEEEFRAEAHGFMSWAVAVLATVLLIAVAGLSAASTGATMAALYGASVSKTEATPAAYLVDVLFRPDHNAGANARVSAPPEGSAAASLEARAEAGRIVEAGLIKGEPPVDGDRDRLIELIASQAGVSPDEAAGRIDQMQKDLKLKIEQAANYARKAASYGALWLALSLVFGAIVSITAAIAARETDDRIFG